MTSPDTAPATVSGYKHGRVPRAVRVAQLLDLAEKLFIAHGYDGFAIEELCRVAGVSRPVVYEHFGSKEGVFLACLRRIRDEFDGALLDAAGGAADIDTTLQQGSEAFFTIIERDPARWSLVYGASTGLVGPLAEDLYELRAATVERMALIGAVFAPDADPERLRAFANAISGAGEQLGRWWLRNPEIPRERIVAHNTTFCKAAFDALLT